MCVNSLFLLYYIIIIIIIIIIITIAGGEGTFDHKSGSFRQLASKNYGYDLFVTILLFL